MIKEQKFTPSLLNDTWILRFKVFKTSINQIEKAIQCIMVKVLVQLLAKFLIEDLFIQSRNIILDDTTSKSTKKDKLSL